MSKKPSSRPDSRAEQPVSAQVILRSMSGKQLGEEPITSKNLHDYAPSPEDVAVALEAFSAAGFETGPMVGISFAITAPVRTFERFFGSRLTVERGRVRVGGAIDDEQLQLPLTKLPQSLVGRVIAVTFTPPAELYV